MLTYFLLRKFRLNEIKRRLIIYIYIYIYMKIYDKLVINAFFQSNFYSEHINALEYQNKYI
jgi:hypothetical protein